MNLDTKHKFEVGQKIWAKSGKRYTVLSLRSDNHHKLKGGIGYSVQGERDGMPFGPCRLMPVRPLSQRRSPFQSHFPEMRRTPQRSCRPGNRDCGRLGVLVTPQALLYAKGGVVWARNDYTIALAGTPHAAVGDTRIGGLFGVGAEYNVFASNWSIFAEYNYIDFGSKTYNVAFTAVDFVSVPSAIDLDVEQRFHRVKFGVNYHF